MTEENEAFEYLADTSPKEALKHVEEFQGTVFWEYFRWWMDKTFQGHFKALYHCEKEKIDTIRGRIDAFAEISAFPDTMIEKLKDDIAVQKEAAKVEEARTEEGRK